MARDRALSGEALGAAIGAELVALTARQDQLDTEGPGGIQ